MPRVRYKPWMLYEEAVGFKGAKRLAGAGFTFLGFNIGIMMVMWAAFAGSSRHVAMTPEKNAEANQFLEDRFSSIFDVLTGDGQKSMPQSAYVGRGPG
jgi:hypothetical protein